MKIIMKNTMKNILNSLMTYGGRCVVPGLAACLAAALAGCANVNANTPHTSIRGQIAGQPFSIDNPKDTVLDDLSVSANTNGAASIHIAHLSTVMNPTVVSATGEAGAKLVEAGADAFERGAKALGGAAGAAAGAIVK